MSRLHGFAIHESGHAVAAVALGFKVLKITLVPEIRPDGTRCMGHICYEARATDDPVRVLAVDAAGNLAQKRFDPMATTGCTCGKGHVFSDERLTLATLALHWPNDPAAQAQARREGSELAERIIGEHWEAIRGLALALMNWRTIPGEHLPLMLKSFGGANVLEKRITLLPPSPPRRAG